MILRQLTELCVHDFGAFRLGCETLKKVYFRERNLIRSLWPFPHIHLGPCRLPESPGYQPRVRCGRWRRRPASRADSGREESHQLKFKSPVTARCSGWLTTAESMRACQGQTLYQLRQFCVALRWECLMISAQSTIKFCPDIRILDRVSEAQRRAEWWSLGSSWMEENSMFSGQCLSPWGHSTLLTALLSGL